MVCILLLFPSNTLLADGTRVLSLEPALDTIRMEPVQTRQQHVLLVYLVVKLANGAQFVLFAEVLLVGGCELALWKELDELVVHGSEDLLVEVDQVFVVVLQALLFVLI